MQLIHAAIWTMNVILYANIPHVDFNFLFSLIGVVLLIFQIKERKNMVYDLVFYLELAEKW